MVRWLVCLLALFPLLAQAELSARFERDTIRVNESVRLILETEAAIRGEPDISAVLKYFTVINQATSQNVSITNGQQSTLQRYLIELSPIDIGSFTVGPITLGTESTKPMRITVLPEQKSASGSGEVFIESEVDTDTGYVQQQIILTVRLFLSAQLVDGSLADPDPEATRVERVGEDKRYRINRDGREFSVYERRFALFPQKSGPLEIPPVRFTGIANDRREGNQVFGSMFDYGHRVRANGAAIELMVKPPPASFSGKTWLPATALQLDEIGSAGGQDGNAIETRTEVGQPLTRRIQLQASGLTADQLPDIEFGRAEGARFYPDKATRDTVPADGGLVGILQSSVAVVGAREGEVSLPPIRVPWWNVVTDREEVAELPGRSMLFIPSSIDGSVLRQGDGFNPDEPGSVGASVGSNPSTIPANAGEPGWWRWLALASIGLWLVSGIVLIAVRRRREEPPRDPRHDEQSVSLAYWRQRLADACRRNNAADARQALAGWTAGKLGGQGSLASLSARVSDAEFRQLIRALDRTVYAADTDSKDWNGGPLWHAFKRYQPDVDPVAGAEDVGKEGHGLVPLYPRSAQ